MRVRVNKIYNSNETVLLYSFKHLDISNDILIDISNEIRQTPMSQAKTNQIATAFVTMKTSDTTLRNLRKNFPDGFALLIASIFHGQAQGQRAVCARILDVTTLQLWRWERNTPQLQRLMRPDVWERINAAIKSDDQQQHELPAKTG